MRDDIYNNREQKIIDNIPNSINEIKVSLGKELVAYTQASSATLDSLQYIAGENREVNPDLYDSGQEASAEKSKQRVLTMNNSPYSNMNSSEPVVNNSIDKPNYGPVVSDYGQSSDPWSLGSVSTLILIFTAILVAMVALVSVMIFNHVGL